MASSAPWYSRVVGWVGAAIVDFETMETRPFNCPIVLFFPARFLRLHTWRSVSMCIEYQEVRQCSHRNAMCDRVEGSSPWRGGFGVRVAVSIG